MKKTISLVLVAIMLLSCVAFAIPASALATASAIDYKEALYFETAPTIDGYISEAEWGQHTVFVEAWDCATIDDTTPYYNFFYNRISATNRDDYGNFSYYIWLRWDLNKFYIGVKVNDPDGHSLKNGTTNTWNGDAVQTRIDKNGANGAVSGGDFTVTADRQKPWSTTSVPDFLFGYVEIAGGFSEAWENTTNKGMTSFSNNPMGVTQCVVAPAGSSYSPDTSAGITTYEAAIPWSYIYNGEYESLEMKQYAAGRDTATKGPRGAIGKELGMSLVVLNDGADATGGWDAFMSWGSGICQAHHEEGAAACSGSNSVVLVETPVSQTAGYQTYDPTSLLDAKFSTNHLDAAGTFYDYLAGDTIKASPIAYSALSSLKYDDQADLSVWGAPEYQGSIGTAKDAKGSDTNVLDYRDPAIAQSYLDTRDGTTEYRYPTSYTLEFDIMYTGVEQNIEGYASELYNWFGGSDVHSFMCGYFFNDAAFKVVNSNDPNEVIARYSYDLKKDTWYNWKFQYDNNSCNARLWIDDLSTEADNAESGTAGAPGYTCEWGTLAINARWRYFFYSSEKDLTDGTLLLFRQMNTQVVYDNVKIYNFASIGEISAPSEGPGNLAGGGGNAGGGGTTGGGTVTGGGSLSVDNAVKGEDNVWSIPVTVAPQYLSATELSFTVKFDATKGTFQGIKGLEEGTYTVEEIAPGELLIKITNFEYVQSLKAGDKFFEILIKTNDGIEKLEEISLDLADAYTYRNTGDGMVFIIVAVAVSILGCAIVIGKRRSAVR